HPLSETLDAAVLRDGLVEEEWRGAGWAPMLYSDHRDKRTRIDQVDRYTAVVRLRDGTLVFPAPAATSPPAPDTPDPGGIDPATVADYAIVPDRDVLADRGWMHRDLALPPAGSRERPAVLRDGEGLPWFLRFDGERQGLVVPAPSSPPGPVTVEMWIRPARLDRPQNLVGWGGSVLSLSLSPRPAGQEGGHTERYLTGHMDAPPAVVEEQGRVILARLDEHRRAVEVVGGQPLAVGRWTQVAATFTGARIELFIDGRRAGAPAAVTGLQMDEQRSFIAGWPWRTMRGFAGDNARFRVLQRSCSEDEVARWHGQLRAAFP
ncbi:MAG: LamG domain-containing protein, partial [Planctomycetes bacterium]|nr:LamG domain-containing protein [Planctomycetota bacterium]